MFSVLMSIYSRESPQALEESLNSLVFQTVLPEEVVLVEDGPLTPELKSVIEKFRELLPLRSLVLPENVGLAEALNKGLEVVDQPWVMRFDTDDISVPNRIEVQMEWMKSDNYDLFGAQIVEFINNPNESGRSREVPCYGEDIKKMLKRRNPFNHMTACFRTALAREVGGYPNIRFMEDYALWVKMIVAGARIGNSSKVLVRARIGNGMLKRRGGVRYLRSEWKLRSTLFELKQNSAGEAIFYGLLRSTAFISPVLGREILYGWLLRS